MITKTTESYIMKILKPFSNFSKFYFKIKYTRLNVHMKKFNYFIVTVRDIVFFEINYLCSINANTVELVFL